MLDYAPGGQVSVWYHLVMAMTLRTEPEDDSALATLAAHWGLSKQQAALRAIREQAALMGHRERVRDAVEIVAEQWSPALAALRDR